MLSRLAAAVLLAGSLRGCVAYEYEHEFWLKVDGSGSVNVTGRPELWEAFKGLAIRQDAPDDSIRSAARSLFERSGLRVRRVTVTTRNGQRYLFVAADFADVNRLWGTPAFPDLRLVLRPEGGRLLFDGTWSPGAKGPSGHLPRDGLMAVRFHLPSRIYEHKNAPLGVERGNILGWRQGVAQALDGRPLEMGAVLDSRSILGSTVALFGTAIFAALALIGVALALVVRRGRSRSGPG
ncbi:MAG: hypothetical protein ACHQNV_04660 [Vicinamibacteria bacterium]